jgi:hypothetical protein
VATALLTLAVGLPLLGVAVAGRPIAWLLDPAGPGFVAVAGLLLTAALALGAQTPRGRGWASAAVGLLLTAAGLALLASAAGTAGSWAATSGLSALVTPTVAPGALLLAASAALPAAWLGCAAAPGRLAPRLLLAGAGALTLLAYLGLQWVGGGPGAPVVALVEALAGSASLGARLAAATALLPLATSLAALVALAWPSRRLLAQRPWPWLHLAAVVAPLALVAAFAAPPSAWAATLEPLSLAALLGAALTLLAFGTGAALAPRTPP